MSSRAATAAASPGRCGSTSAGTAPPRSATSRCCSRPSRRSGSARDRAAAGRAAAAAGRAAVVMDDGFQNPGAGEGPLDRGRRRGLRLRQRPGDAGRARCASRSRPGSRAPTCCSRSAGAGAGAVPRTLAGAARCRCSTARSRRCRPAWTGRGLRAFAFAGIGRPEKFFATPARRSAPSWSAAHGFADHAPYGAAPAGPARAPRRRRSGAQLVTTEKDAVRLPAAFRAKVLVLPVRLALADWTALDAALDRLGA